MNEPNALRIRSAVEHLRESPGASRVFGFLGHRFLLEPPLPLNEIEAFERQHAVTLPDDFRWFLHAVANGGAGPYYGVFPLGLTDGTSRSLEPWTESDGFVGILSSPFPHTKQWNDLTGMPPDDLTDRDEDMYERLMDEFHARYWNSANINGAIPICHLGCALRIWLVVTGPERGHVWRDDRADHGGLLPLEDRDRNRVSFLSWYESWLSAAASEAAQSPTPTPSSP